MIDTAQTALEAERALLGAMMLDQGTMWHAFDLVAGTDFLDPRHEQVFEAIHRVAQGADGDDRIDALAVSDDLLKHGAKIDVEFVFTLTSAVTTAKMGDYHAGIVARHSGLRRVMLAATRIQQGVSEGRDVNAILDDARAALDTVTESRTTLQPIGADFAAFADELDKIPSYRLTRWGDLNRYLGGLMPGAVYVVAGRPGEGKSMAALNMAVDLAKHGPVALVSLEMMKPELLRRMTAAEAEVSLTKLTRNRLERADWDAVNHARHRIEGMPLYIDDRMGSSMTQIEAFVRQVARKGPLAGVVIDYLQLIPSTGSGQQSRAEFIATLTRAFKQLAMRLQVPVILLSQINRESERNQRLPGLADLRESGAIEQDADAVIFLARRRDKDGQYLDVVDVIIAKSRHGSMGRLELGWEGKFARLVPMRRMDPEMDWRARQAGE